MCAVKHSWTEIYEAHRRERRSKGIENSGSCSRLGGGGGMLWVNRSAQERERERGEWRSAGGGKATRLVGFMGQEKQ